jgi:hypothetical protein
MNVSKEADVAFMHEVERTDPARYANLIQNGIAGSAQG